MQRCVFIYVTFRLLPVPATGITFPQQHCHCSTEVLGHTYHAYRAGSVHKNLKSRSESKLLYIIYQMNLSTTRRHCVIISDKLPDILPMSSERSTAKANNKQKMSAEKRPTDPYFRSRSTYCVFRTTFCVYMAF